MQVFHCHCIQCRCYWATMRRKLGLLETDEAEEDQELITDLLQVMHDTGADFTNTFCCLSTVRLGALQSQRKQMNTQTKHGC